jgi:hypothetical protein
MSAGLDWAKVRAYREGHSDRRTTAAARGALISLNGTTHTDREILVSVAPF